MVPAREVVFMSVDDGRLQRGSYMCSLAKEVLHVGCCKGGLTRVALQRGFYMCSLAKEVLCVKCCKGGLTCVALQRGSYMRSIAEGAVHV